MMDYFWQLPALGKLFALCASTSTLLFIIRTISMIIGGDVDDMDSDIDDGDSDEAFRLLSTNGIIAFIMMAGWMGLASLIQFKLPASVSLLCSLGAGFFSMYITALIFKMAGRLTSSGENFSIEQLKGLTGTVYQEIPENGKGKIHISTREGSLKELDAVSLDNGRIPSFSIIEVVDNLNNLTVIVKIKTGE